MDNPINKFENWWQEALFESPLNQKNAVCISTVDEKGFAASRFVDLKAVSTSGFVFCSNLDSEKGKHIELNHKVALTAWWDHVGFQVRVVGTAAQIAPVEADLFWQARSRAAQLATMAFTQNEPIASEEELAARFQKASAKAGDQPIPRPHNWGGYCIKPISIEFLTFRESRLHLRECFELSGSGWVRQLLQP